MEKPPETPDPYEDWGQDTERRIRLLRLAKIGYLWGIIAMAIGAMVLAAIMLGWV